MSALPSIEPAATAQEAEQTRALYEQYSRRIFGYCLRRLPSREEAEDAVQHTFMNAFGGLRKGVVPRSEAAWLFKIAENVCRERRRSAWRRDRADARAPAAAGQDRLPPQAGSGPQRADRDGRGPPAGAFSDVVFPRSTGGAGRARRKTPTCEASGPDRTDGYGNGSGRTD